MTTYNVHDSYSIYDTLASNGCKIEIPAESTTLGEEECYKECVQMIEQWSHEHNNTVDTFVEYSIAKKIEVYCNDGKRTVSFFKDFLTHLIYSGDADDWEIPKKIFGSVASKKCVKYLWTTRFNLLSYLNKKEFLYKSLKKHGFRVGALHGDLDQSVRFATLNAFKANELQLLVCSDVAARGLDIGGLSHVFNFDVPFHSEDYVHRIGRTGRAGREGRAFSIATADDARNVAGIEKLTGQPLPRIAIEGLDVVPDEEIAEALTKPRGRGRGGPAARPGARAPERGGRDRAGRGPREERAPRYPRREPRPLG